MMDEASQDNINKNFFRGLTMENSLPGLQMNRIPDLKDFEEMDHAGKAAKSKSYNFPIYNGSNMSAIPIFDDKHEMEITQNNYDNILAANTRKDIFASKHNFDFDISGIGSNPNSMLHFPFNNFGFNDNCNLHYSNNLSNLPLPSREDCIQEKNGVKDTNSMGSNKFKSFFNFEPQIFMNHKETVKRLLPMGTLEEEPRYVNEKQYNRMMIRRIKRAKEMTMKSQIQNVDQNFSDKGSKKKYKYESRHLHATKRPRDTNGKFLKKENIDRFCDEPNFIIKKRMPKIKKENKEVRKNNLKKLKMSKNILMSVGKNQFRKMEEFNQISINPSKKQSENMEDSGFGDIGNLNDNLTKIIINPLPEELDSDDKNLLSLTEIKKEEEFQ